MKSETSLDSGHPLSPPQKSSTLDTSAMLTPSELADLRRASSENVALLQKAYPGVQILR